MVYVMFSTLSKKLPYSIRGLSNFEVELLFLKERKVLKSFIKTPMSLAYIYIYIYLYITYRPDSYIYIGQTHRSFTKRYIYIYITIT